MSIQGTFTITGASGSMALYVPTMVVLNFTGSGTVTLQVSYNGGTSWVNVYSWTADAAERVNATPDGHLFRLNCTARGANIGYRLG